MAEYFHCSASYHYLKACLDYLNKLQSTSKAPFYYPKVNSPSELEKIITSKKK